MKLLDLMSVKLRLSASAVRKKHYYVTARDVGHRLIDLGLKNLELAFYGAGTTPQERQKVKELKKNYGDNWPAKWMENRDWSKKLRNGQPLRGGMNMRLFLYDNHWFLRFLPLCQSSRHSHGTYSDFK